MELWDDRRNARRLSDKTVRLFLQIKGTRTADILRAYTTRTIIIRVGCHPRSAFSPVKSILHRCIFAAHETRLSWMVMPPSEFLSVSGTVRRSTLRAWHRVPACILAIAKCRPSERCWKGTSDSNPLYPQVERHLSLFVQRLALSGPQRPESEG
ncbi:hypothetical protein AVEN_208041-1 [Araneus ventricosus]|uniref:Uncharacterized protein n=1 Tax=Araneus ventricosus TaxID=182803 RepID=A0A4Y2F2S9_ARAVE|nr:hypothetical protein AVEN_208041-1 [Araneus ventricosus]